MGQNDVLFSPVYEGAARFGATVCVLSVVSPKLLLGKAVSMWLKLSLNVNAIGFLCLPG